MCIRDRAQTPGSYWVEANGQTVHFRLPDDGDPKAVSYTHLDVYKRQAEYFAEHLHFYDDYDRKGPHIFLGELAVVRGWVGQLYAALGEAAFLIGMELNQDIVELASYAPLLELSLIHIYNSSQYFEWKAESE